MGKKFNPVDLSDYHKEIHRRWQAPTPAKAKAIFEAAKWYVVTIFTAIGVFSTHDFGIPNVILWIAGATIIPVALVGFYAKTREVK